MTDFPPSLTYLIRNKVMRFLFLLMIALSPSVGHSAVLQLSNNTRVEVVESFTAQELWNSTTPSTVTVGNVVADFRKFDSEASPKNGNWTGCAIVMFGTGDVGARPVAFRVWTKRSCDFSINSEPSNSRLNSEFTMRVDLNEILKIHVAPLVSQRFS